MNRPRGTRDFAPQEQQRRIELLDSFRGIAKNYGFQEVQTPTFEELQLFTAKSGDGIIGELYNFQDKGERDMCLRPEVTAPIMRMYFTDHAFAAKPIKWTYYANCFRYDRPQAGRYREFWQYGCEIIGAGSPLAYAELIAFADSLLHSTGVNYTLRIGHVALLRQAVAALQLDDTAALMRAIDKKDMDAVNALDPEQKLQAIFANDLRSFEGEAATQLQETVAYLAAAGVQFEIDLSIARGLDYYTGVVFEAHCDNLGSQSQILGGGGYDLSAIFDAPSTPTMGFGLGFDRVIVALGEDGQGGSDMDVYLGGLSAAANQALVPLAAQLRGLGLSVGLHLTSSKPAAIAKSANHASAKQLIMVGDRDLAARAVAVKDMESGQSVTVPIDNLPSYLIQS